ncbi:phosphohistidine phosphatase SixA [Halomonas chromatireducens]|uniref:Phosphohistidine phosphatase SixA n=1 Tax=Halomonas chromatireducens TaxID=507626 RepID=A0A0X8HC92_9GAMM|nr:phosphohistidine phosphatase SixA [Halomonas chromatireducens]AMC99949.1 Phosphohistidine phosphatase SixA [Halomonas chromatireducens]
MSKRLLIMRHGEAGPGSVDAERTLTVRGHAEAARMADWLQYQELAQARILASPYRRAQQTAVHVAASLGCEIQTLGIVTPDDPPEAVIDWLLEQTGRGPFVLVSHMPLVGAVTGLLVEGRSDRGLGFPTAAVAELEAEVWAAGCARLLRFMAPNDVTWPDERP